jgi:hypothetical protein
MNLFSGMSKEDRSRLSDAYTATFENPERLASACAQIRTIGAPNYRPTYMIQHGLGAFMGGSGKNGLVEPFDETAGWEESLSGYLHCPAPESKR